MAKDTGLNVRLYVEGNDLSGDANSLDGVGYTQELFDTTTLDQSAVSRLAGRVDGSLSASAFFDAATTHISAVMTANSGKLPTADQNVLIPLSSAAGSPAYGCIAKESDYGVSGSIGSPVTVSASYSINGTAPEFGEMLTAHDDTHASAGSGTVVDSGASSSNGASGYCHIFSLASGTVTVKIQHCATSDGTYADLISFTATATGAVPVAYRATASGTVNRYIKVVTTGTFGNAKIAVALSRS